VPHRPEDDWTRPLPRTRRGEPAPWPTHDGWDQASDERWDQASDDGWDQASDDGWDQAPDPWEDGGWVEPRRRREGPRDLAEDRAAHRVATTPRPAPSRPAAQHPPRPPRYGARRVLVVVTAVVLVYVVALVWAAAASWLAIGRVDATPDNPARPSPAAGTNILLVGTDSRADLTDEQRRELRTGSVEGARADTLMVLHMPGLGQDPTLLSVPRDSYVEIPGYGFNKINAAYALEGPALMVDAVEQSTGLAIEGYVEIGFDGFVDVVGAVGGVRMCLPEPVVEERSDLDLAAGCQELEGKDALAYVRMRYADPRGDLGRVERQRQFLAALVQEMTRPSTLLVPWELHEAGTATGSALRIGEDTSLVDMMRVGLAMRSISGGDGTSLTVPVADSNYQTEAGSSVLWDEAEAARLFQALRDGESLTIEP
jgi:LCP family protein required for cell wall assembly